MESVVNREVAAANRLSELTASGEALEQRQVSAQVQSAELEKLREELEARKSKAEEQVRRKHTISGFLQVPRNAEILLTRLCLSS